MVGLVCEFSRLQAQLLDSLHATFPAVVTLQPHEWPQRVDIRVGEHFWHGARHGAGFRFESDDSRVVEAHDGILRAPYPIEAYRLSEYAQSLRLTTLSVGRHTSVTSEPEGIDAALPPLVGVGVLVRDDRVVRNGLQRYIATCETFNM